MPFQWHNGAYLTFEQCVDLALQKLNALAIYSPAQDNHHSDAPAMYGAVGQYEAVNAFLEDAWFISEIKRLYRSELNEIPDAKKLYKIKAFITQHVAKCCLGHVHFCGIDAFDLDVSSVLVLCDVLFNLENAQKRKNFILNFFADYLNFQGAYKKQTLFVVAKTLFNIYQQYPEDLSPVFENLFFQHDSSQDVMNSKKNWNVVYLLFVFRIFLGGWASNEKSGENSTCLCAHNVSATTQFCTL